MVQQSDAVHNDGQRGGCCLETTEGTASERPSAGTVLWLGHGWLRADGYILSDPCDLHTAWHGQHLGIRVLYWRDARSAGGQYHRRTDLSEAPRRSTQAMIFDGEACGCEGCIDPCAALFSVLRTIFRKRRGMSRKRLERCASYRHIGIEGEEKAREFLWRDVPF